MSLVKLIFVVFVLYNSYLTSSFSVLESETQRVSPNCTKVVGLSDCIELDKALQSLVSNTILYLEPGRHVLYTYHGWNTFSLHNISIIGIQAETEINCHEENGVGMTFINVTSLFISNITIDGCGLTGSNLRNATDIIETFLFVNFLIPDSIKIGLFLAHCTNLQMENSLINNTRGLGLLGVNILGNSSITNVNFTHNIRPKCVKIDPNFPDDRNLLKPMQIGGGAYFLYLDYQTGYSNSTLDMSNICISRCNFKYNAECTSTGIRNVDYQYVQSPKYSIGGGGGLSIYMPQITYSVTAKILSSNFIKNDARYGGGMQIGLFAGFVKSFVQIYGCTFDRNGFEVEDKSQAYGGAGIAVFMDLLRYSNTTDAPSTINCEKCKKIDIISTNFTRNSARVQGGGMFAYSFSKNFRANYGPDDFNAILQLEKCLFQYNSAKYGSGLYVSQRTTQGIDGAWALVLSDVIVRNNTAPTPIGIGPGFDNADKISAVDLRNILVRIKDGNVSIESNGATGIRMLSSIIFMFSKTLLLLKNNQASRGGGIYMDGHFPAIIAHNSSTVDFRNNVATAEGGGLYYERQPTEHLILEPLNTLDCFITTYNAYGSFGKEMFDSNITVVFSDNTAPIGSMVFGSTLNSCSWARQFNLSDKDLFLELYKNHSSTFKFSHIPEGKNRVSTTPNSIHVLEDNTSISLYPGEEQTIKVSVLDVFENPIEAVITSSIFGEHSVNISLGSSGFWYNDVWNEVPIHVNGTSDSPITLSLYTISNLVWTNITVNVLRCPSGFVYNKTCQCSPLLKSNGIECDPNTVEITVPRNKWLGCANHSSECSTEDLMLLECYFDQCTSKEVVFDQSDYSNQCANYSHRIGIMCGSCEEGYSVILGNNNCGKCSDTTLGILIAVAVVGGLVLFALITLLQITIDKGWTDMVILFSNIVFPYSFPTALAIHSYKNLLIPLRWINLELGFDLCIYNGATSLIQTVYYILFPVYLYTLMFFFALLCRYSSFASRHFSPNKTLITLIFLTYISILSTCAGILAPVNAMTLGGNSEQVRWLIDPSVLYFKSWHAALVVASVVTSIVYIIPFPLLLLSPTLAYKYGNRFKPVLDAIWAPFKPKYRIWASVRLLLRILIIMCTKFIFFPFGYGFNINLFFLATFLFFQTYIQPFKDNVINFFDNFLILIALFFHFIGYVGYNYTKGSYVKYCIAFLVILSYLVIVLTFLWYSRLSAKRLWNKIAHCCCRAARDRRFTFDTLEKQSIQSARPTHTSVSINSSESSKWMPHSPHRRSFTHARESLLEDEALRFISN